LEKLSKRDNFEVNPRLTLIVAVCEAHTKKFDVKTKGVLNVGRIETRGIPDFHVPAEKNGQQLHMEIYSGIHRNLLGYIYFRNPC
jgi:hypothetical protein